MQKYCQRSLNLLRLYFPILFFKPSHFDMSHVINGLQFGDVITVSFILISSLLLYGMKIEFTI